MILTASGWLADPGSVLAATGSFLGPGWSWVRQSGLQIGINLEQPIDSREPQDTKHGVRLDDQPQLCVSLCGV